MKIPDDQLRIAVVCGGPSAEAEVSRVSGRGVANALSATFPNVLVLELDDTIVESLRAQKIDVVFPALHGPPGEDGTFQGFLEIVKIPYVGSGVRASMAAMDKAVAKMMFQAAGLPIADGLVAEKRLGASTEAKRIIDNLGTDLVVKPTSQGSALGISFVRDAQSLKEALEKAFGFGETALVESRIEGKEITVGILERDGVEALPVIEITTPKDTWYDFQHRYTPGLSEHLIPARLPREQYLRTQEIAKLAHTTLGCRDLSRVDFVVPDQGEPIILEVNTLPGMTPTSLYPDAAKAVGMSFEMLVAHLVRRAVAQKIVANHLE